MRGAIREPPLRREGEEEEEMARAEDAKAKGKAPRRGLFGRKPKARLGLNDMVLFTRQLSTMISAGIPILQSLEVLQEQTTDPGFKVVLDDVLTDVRSGMDFSDSLGRHPRVFARIYVSMIKAGEASGQIDIMLVRLADYFESTARLRRRIRSAMTYPVISLVLITSITLFLMMVIIPKFEGIFVELFDSPDKLPGPTKVVMSISRMLRQQTLQVLLGAVAITVAFVLWKRTETGAYQWDKIQLRLPVFGPLLQKVAIARFARTFSTLLTSGVPILGALEIVAATAGNRVVERAVQDAQDAIREGEPLAVPLGKAGVFPVMVVQMISIGERSGSLDQLLEKIAQFYDEMVNATVEALTSLIEPLMIGVMGLMVGGIVVAVFYPIIKLPEMMKGGG